MDSQNDTVNALEPNSFTIYVAILILSLLIFLASSSGILFCLFLSYKDWCCLIHQYCTNIVYLKFPDNDYESNKMTSTDRHDINPDPKILLLSDDEEISEEVSKPTRQNPDNLSARVTKITIRIEEVLEEMKIIEIEPTGFSDNIQKSEKQIRSMGPDKELGRISFTIEYYSQKQELHIKNMRGEGLRKKHSQEILNPFITVNIWPDQIWPIKTKVIQRTNTPTWIETIIIEQFEFKNLSNKALHLKVQSRRQLRPNDLIGHVVLPLQIIKTTRNDDTFKEYFVKNLQPELQINRGSIRILLLYKEDTEEIKITILNSKLIYPPGIIPDQCQVFTKVTVLHPNMDAQNKFTAIQRGSFQPVWNEQMTFKVSSDKLYKLSIIISVREEGFSKDGKLFAYTELGPQHSESNNFHLYTTLKNPNKIIAQWHQLISNLL